ncbi:hypothetical protein EDD17DRAFT_1620774 [Pisolithus thermaeus]|nr:hypothetical protein EV401DRAFT_1948543 [Pisolithus croceorrhizus]KAI6123070.1 hypothetical protein EV401DRAFT_1948554 [Pisolithus croceorrhizus]KAI6158634.1 hypothetical protein EDD17DRAFT_1620761 [Pisolithus thermaeus]KAI6158635.1 hypothetical protein EDD17DRAFT_1620774 [Pisolithus thermaeus]
MILSRRLKMGLGCLELALCWFNFNVIMSKGSQSFARTDRPWSEPSVSKSCQREIDGVCERLRVEAGIVFTHVCT